jgi:hypothetical protein
VIAEGLDAFHRCPVPGCEWQIHRLAVRCYNHRGPALAQYLTDAEGAITKARFMPAELDPDYDPLPAA